MTGISKPYKIPESWIWTTIESITLKVTDGSHNPPRKEASNSIPMLSAKNILNNHISFQNVRHISEMDYDNEYYRTDIEPGDILLTIVASIGRCAIVPRLIKQKFAIQ